MTAVLNLLDFYKETLHEKINTIARHTENKTGIKLGASRYDVELDRFLEFHQRRMQEVDKKIRELEELRHVEDIGKRKLEAFRAQFQGADCPDPYLRR